MLCMNERAWRTGGCCAHGAALRSLRNRQIATPVTRHARCRAAEVLPDRAGSARVPVVRLRLTWCHARRGAAGSHGWGGRLRAAAAPGDLSQRPPLLRALGGTPAACNARAAHRAPPSCAPSLARGTCGGIFERWAGTRAHHFGCRFQKTDTTHLTPLPVREEAVPTPRPPVGGSEEVRAEGSVQRNANPASGWSF
jgi:hypothetical protein